MEKTITPEQDLINRYRLRLSEIETIPNGYYKNPSQEKEEIERKILELQQVIKKQKICQ